MSNSNINRIEPIVPYSKYWARSTIPGIISRIRHGGPPQKREKYKELIQERLNKMSQEEIVERIQKNEEKEGLFRETLEKKYGNELVTREINEVEKLKRNELSLEECEKKLKQCGICSEQLDPSNFGNENSVVMVGNGRYKQDGRNAYPILEKNKNTFLGQCIQQYGMGRNSLAEKLGITFDELYDEYMSKCNISECDYNCLLSDITSNSNLQKILDKRNKPSIFFYTDIDCGHKFHKKCILRLIEEKKGIYERDTVRGRPILRKTKNPYKPTAYENFSAPVTCPTCSEPIRQLYYFLPTYCDKIDETGEFIRKKRDITTQNKTKKNLTFADDKNETRFYDKTSETDKFEYGGKRKRVRKNRKHKKTRKYKKN